VIETVEGGGYQSADDSGREQNVGQVNSAEGAEGGADHRAVPFGRGSREGGI